MRQRRSAVKQDSVPRRRTSPERVARSAAEAPELIAGQRRRRAGRQPPEHEAIADQGQHHEQPGIEGEANGQAAISPESLRRMAGSGDESNPLAVQSLNAETTKKPAVEATALKRRAPGEIGERDGQRPALEGREVGDVVGAVGDEAEHRAHPAAPSTQLPPSSAGRTASSTMPTTKTR